MYAKRDFRYLIQRSKEYPEEELIKSISREPFPELLEYWESSGKPQHLYGIYAQGIEEAIYKERYPYYQLDLIGEYPEFYSAMLDGLIRLWKNVRFSLLDHSLLIDSPEGKNINITNDFKMDILKIIPYRMTVHLLIGEKTKIRALVLTSRRAELIYQLISWMQILIE